MCVYVKANMEMTEVLSFHQAAVLSSPPRQDGANQLARYEGHIYITCSAHTTLAQNQGGREPRVSIKKSKTFLQPANEAS